MAVAFDAVASASGFSSATASLSWTHTAGAGGSVVIVGIAWGSSSFPPTLSTITYGGTTMTLLGSIATNNTSSNGGVLLYGITGQASGAHTVQITATGAPSNVVIGNSISFTGAASFGTAVTNFGSSASATVTVTGTTSGNMVVSVEAHGTNGAVTYTSGTQRFDDEVTAATGASNLSGATIAAGGSVSLTDTITNDVWGAVGVEVKAPAGGGPSGTVQPRATIPVPRRRPARGLWGGPKAFTGFVAVAAPRQPPYLPPRRRPARAVWAGIKGAAYVAVPAPVQQYRLAPRRVPARAVWRGSTPFTGFAAVPAPRQPPYLPPRRRPARAVVEFTPVTTSNALPVQSAAPPKAPLSLPRRTLARAVWRGGAGQAFVFVPAPAQGPPRPRSPAPRRAAWRAGPVPGITRPAPRQPPSTVYRRGPARAYVRFTPVVTVNATGVAVAAPRQLTTIPRRILARAYVRFTPVTTTNPAFISTAAPAVTADDKTLVKRRIVWRMLSL